MSHKVIQVDFRNTIILPPLSSLDASVGTLHILRMIATSMMMMRVTMMTSVMKKIKDEIL